MSALTRRIAASTGANLYAQATNIGTQLLSLPFYLSHWGLETYGHWLVLSAIPAYFAMADVGMVTAAGNRMTMLTGNDDIPAANRVLQNAAAFMTFVCLGIGAVAMLLILVVPIESLPSEDSKSALALLIVGVLLGLYGGLPEAVYRSTHRYAFATFASTSIRLLEWGGGLVGLFLHGSFFSVALAMLIPRAVGTLLMTLHAQSGISPYRWRFGKSNWTEMKEISGPALGFMAFPLGNAIAFQGVTLVVAATLGPAATAIFNTYRTMARVTVQATATFGNALWPEFSRLCGANDMQLLDKIYKRSYLMGVATSISTCGVVYLIAPYVLSVWSKGKIEFVPTLMLAAMAYSAVAGCWHVCRVLLLATNHHAQLAWQYLLMTALTLPAAWLLSRSSGLTGAMEAMLITEIVMLLLCTMSSHRMLRPSVVQPAENTA